jgi:hypothetical protein
MKIVLFVALLFATSFVCAQTTQAQTDHRSVFVLLPRDQEINLALSAAPEHLRKEAAVYVFTTQGYEKVQPGTNGFVCLVNRDRAQLGDVTLRPTCWDKEGSDSIVPVMLRVGEMLARNRTAAEIKQDIDGGFTDGRFHSPRKSGIAYMLAGDVNQFDVKTGSIVERAFPPHYMIYAPGLTNADIGMTREGYKLNPSLPMVYSGYSGGSRTSYIIVLATDNKPQMVH